MSLNREEVKERIFKLIKDKGPVGWYMIEHWHGIYPEEFPDGMNAMSFVEELVLDGRVSKSETDGKVKYFVNEENGV